MVLVILLVLVVLGLSFFIGRSFILIGACTPFILLFSLAYKYNWSDGITYSILFIMGIAYLYLAFRMLGGKSIIKPKKQ